MTILKIPALYSYYTGKQTEIELDGSTIEEIFGALYQKFPAIKKHILDPKGNQRRHINIFVNKVNILHLKKMDTEVQKDDVITLLPNISGG